MVSTQHHQLLSWGYPHPERERQASERCRALGWATAFQKLDLQPLSHLNPCSLPVQTPHAGLHDGKGWGDLLYSSDISDRLANFASPRPGLAELPTLMLLQRGRRTTSWSWCLVVLSWPSEQRHLSVGNAVRDDVDGQHIPHHFFANCCSGPFFQIAAMDHFLCRVLSWIISMQIVVPDHFLQKVFPNFLGSCHCGSFFCKFLIICFAIVVLDHYFKGLFQFILHILILNRILLAVVPEYFFCKLLFLI